MPHHQGHEEIAQQRLGGEFGPGDTAALGAGLGAVAADVEPAPVQAEGQAGEEVRGQRGEDQEGLEQRRLVVRSRQEEVGVRAVQVAPGEQGKEGGVGQVQGEEEGEGVGGVFLEGDEGAG